MKSTATFETTSPNDTGIEDIQVVDPIAILKRNVSDTLTFLHQERNDFLPQDDVIIPTRKDDHISEQIDLDSISNFKKKSNDDLIKNATREVDEVIENAENVVNKRVNVENNRESLDNLESLKDDTLTTAFKFLDNEHSSASSTPLNDSDSKTVTFDVVTEDTRNKSGIPVMISKPVEKIRKNDSDKDVDLLLSYEGTGLPTESELFTKIPIMGANKVKTIKKHSKDPLKEFVKLSQDVNWDDDIDDGEVSDEIPDNPIVKTTSTRITSETTPSGGGVKSKIPVLHTETLSPTEICERYSSTSGDQLIGGGGGGGRNSKIPVILNKSGGDNKVTSPKRSKGEASDSDEEGSPKSPPLKGILKNRACVRTVGSSSGSDVALHEEGAELSESDTGMFKKLLQLPSVVLSFTALK